MSAAAAEGTRRGILHNRTRFMINQENDLAPNTSNNNSDAAPGVVSNINYMPRVLGNAGPVRGTRRLRGLNHRNLSNRNKLKLIIKNITRRRRREKFLRTLNAQRQVPVRSQLPAAAAAVAAPAYVYENRRANDDNHENTRYVNGINTYDPASWFSPGMGSNSYETRLARTEAHKLHNENEARAREERNIELSRWG